MPVEIMTPQEIINAIQAGTPLIAPRCGGKRLTLSIVNQMAHLIALEEEYRKLKEESTMVDIDLPETIQPEPCPHCGNTQLVGRRYLGKDGFCDRFAILCHYGNGGCGAESGHYHTLAEAVSNWNSRDGIESCPNQNDTKPNPITVDWSDWKSPITLTTTPFITKMCQEMENDQSKLILEACQQVGVTIDKEELMRAIRYDRDQFSQGWLAGYNKALRGAWIDPAVQTPDDEQTVFFYDNDGEYHVGWYRAEDQDFDCDSYYVDLIDVLGWQPCVKSGEDANA